MSSGSVVVTGGTGALGARRGGGVPRGRRPRGRALDRAARGASTRARLARRARARGARRSSRPTSPRSRRALARREAAGDVAVLVNGVGGFAGGAPLDETALDVWDRMYRMNVRTPRPRAPRAGRSPAMRARDVAAC